MAGIAGRTLFQGSPNSTMTGHSGADTLDKVNEAMLEQDAAMVAVTALWISDCPVRIVLSGPRSGWQNFARSNVCRYSS